MYVCMYVMYMYVCMLCTCMYVCMYVCYVCMYMYVCMYVMYMYVCMYVCYVCMYMYVCMYVMYMYVCMYVCLYVLTVPPYHPNETVPLHTHVHVLCPDNDSHSRSKLSSQIINIHKRVSCVWFKTSLSIWVFPFYSIVFKIKCVVGPATSSHAHYTWQMFNCKFRFKHWIISEIKSS